MLQALALDEDLFEAQFFLARNLRLQGDREAAVSRFRIASALRRSDFRSCGLLGEELRALGRNKEAEYSWREALERIDGELERHPDNAGALALWTQYDRGLVPHEDNPEFVMLLARGKS